MLEAWTPRESTRFLMLEQMVQAAGPGPGCTACLLQHGPAGAPASIVAQPIATDRRTNNNRTIQIHGKK
jgi:hypothetical protein